MAHPYDRFNSKTVGEPRVSPPSRSTQQREQFREGFIACLRALGCLKGLGYSRETERVSMLESYTAYPLKAWVVQGGDPYKRPPIPFADTSWWALRDAVFERDGRLCSFCGAVHDLQIDHITPVCEGGVANMRNLRVLCKPCNIGRNGGNK
jgi:hypothetical protein